MRAECKQYIQGSIAKINSYLNIDPSELPGLQYLQSWGPQLLLLNDSLSPITSPQAQENHAWRAVLCLIATISRMMWTSFCKPFKTPIKIYTTMTRVTLNHFPW